MTFLVWLSSYTGWQFSIGMVIVSGIVGAYLARRSSAALGVKFRDHLQQGKMSSDLLSDGAMIMFAAGLLLTPGFLTDFFGLSLLIPVCRRWYKSLIMGWFKKNFKMHVVTMPTHHDPNTVDGEVVDRHDVSDGPTVLKPELLE
jgi:UPF0716 protein FxsA